MLEKIKKWLYDNWPVGCALCGKMSRRRNMRHERTTTGRLIPLCPDCHKSIFYPFRDTLT